MASLISSKLFVISLSFFITTLSYAAASYSPSAVKQPSMNVIDRCWRAKPTGWAKSRHALADCGIGYGRDAIGGKNGAIYVVTDSSDDPVKPRPGTLRYGVVQIKPLWIVFARDMVITLKNELIVNSYKTIDGRGAKVEIAYGPCITLQHVSHVIIHGISIHDCKPGKAGLVMSTIAHVGHRRGCNGDGIDIFGSDHIWIDHCYLARCSDGLIDVIHGSTAITISNNYFTQHDKVMLFGHHDGNAEDKVMKVTVAFNHFGPGLIQRMPRVRLGYAHVANNRYDMWQMYAIGGSSNPTIFSEGNYFMAPNTASSKEVTKREIKQDGWKTWKWRSSRDKFMNGAYFEQSGYGSCSPGYSRAQSFPVADGLMALSLTKDAGPLKL